jgi:hypothetical protein
VTILTSVVRYAVTILPARRKVKPGGLCGLLTNPGAALPALQIPISPPPLCRGNHRQSLTGLVLARVDLDQLLAVGADASPIAHESNGAEQIAFDHEQVESRHALVRIDPMQHEMMLDRRSIVLHVCESRLAAARGEPCQSAAFSTLIMVASDSERRSVPP